MPNRQKHYTSRKMIEDDIDQTIRRAEKLEVRGAELEMMLKKILALDNPLHAELAFEMKEAMQAVQDKAMRIRTVRLKRLSNTLAAFQTETLPGMEDNSVVLQKL